MKKLSRFLFYMAGTAGIVCVLLSAVSLNYVCMLLRAKTRLCKNILGKKTLQIMLEDMGGKQQLFISKTKME
jgi:hypothetical protein